MQRARQTERLNRLRRELRSLVQEFERTLDPVFERSALVKGNVYEMARKCGKTACVCTTQGRLHRAMVLSWSQNGRTRLISIPLERLEELRRKSAHYLRFRAARARVTQLHRRILKVLDRIEKLRREKP